MNTNEERKEIIQCITDFIKGGDESDLKKLDKILHKEYRNVQLGFFAEKGLFIIDKRRYLSLIEENTFGGTPRSMDVISIDINGDIASAKAKLESKTMIFYSFITLIRDDDIWYIMGNYPHFEYKNQII